MKTRLILIILLLVVLPTALLSVLAGMTLKSREAVLQQGIEMAAMNAINSTAAHLTTDLLRALDHVRQEMSDCIAAGGEYRKIERLSAQLGKDNPLVAEALVFMNPWAFVYPDIEKPDTTGVSRADMLVPAMRRAVANATPSNSLVRFSVADGAYLFLPVEGKKDLYVGYRVNQPAFRKQLAERLNLGIRGGFTIAAEGPDLLVLPRGGRLPGEVVVKDSLGGEAVEVEADSGTLARIEDKALASGRLQKPFDYIRLSAFLSEPAETRKAAGYEARLYGWGVLLLAAAVLAGVLMIVRDAVLEVRRARSQSDFVVGVSHDLRTPLASMKMLAESLHDGHVKDPEKRKKFLGTIMTESERLGQLIERVLFFVRFGQDALVFHPHETDAGELARLSVRQFLASRLHAGHGEADLKVEIEEDLPEVVADETAIQQVLYNLLDNAWKYGLRKEGGGVELRVSKWRGRRGMFGAEREWVRLAVTDHGAGMAKKHLRRIFRRYYRIPGSGNLNVSGVGLGLALCRHIARSHGGWMEVRSEQGRGSEFSLYLPTA